MIICTVCNLHMAQEVTSSISMRLPCIETGQVYKNLEEIQLLYLLCPYSWKRQRGIYDVSDNRFRQTRLIFTWIWDGMISSCDIYRYACQYHNMIMSPDLYVYTDLCNLQLFLSRNINAHRRKKTKSCARNVQLYRRSKFGASFTSPLINAMLS